MAGKLVKWASVQTVATMAIIARSSPTKALVKAPESPPRMQSKQLRHAVRVKHGGGQMHS